MTKGKDKAMLLELAARCEQAMGADRELDFLIAEALANHPEHYEGCRSRQDAPYGDFYKFPEPRPKKWEWNQPAYTASLDAAMTLVPEGWRVQSCAEGYNGKWSWGLAETKDGCDAGGVWAVQRGLAATPALALCAASLRAKAAAQ